MRELKWLGLGVSLKTIFTTFKSLLDRWHAAEWAAQRADYEHRLAEADRLTAELRMSYQIHEDIIRQLRAALDTATGSDMEHRLAGLNAMIEAARRTYNQEWASIQALYNLSDNLVAGGLPVPARLSRGLAAGT